MHILPKNYSNMPLRLLKSIKLRKFCYPLAMKKRTSDCLQFSERYVTGAYVYKREELKSRQFLFNDGFPTLILMPNLSDTAALERKGKHLKTLQSAWVCCGIIKETSWEIPEDLPYIVIVRFSPPVFYTLFDVDPTVFKADPIRNLEDIVSPQWMDIFAEMYALEGIQERMGYLNKHFLSREITADVPPGLELAIEHIDQMRGNITVSELLTVLGPTCNRKWLQRAFLKHLGIPPKKYISLQRFIGAYDQYDSKSREDLLSVALNSGYYDYNHFLKDFKRFLGIAPTQYAWS